MPNNVRIATFNLENLDDVPDAKPTLADRIALMRPQLVRANADILCLQEVNGQEQAAQPRQLLALDQFLAGTQYAAYNRVSTQTLGANPQVYDQRNLVILSRFAISNRIQHDPDGIPLYKKLTAVPADPQAKEVAWERPILYAKITLESGSALHVFNVHLKSKIPTNIDGQKIDNFTWKSCYGWAEGAFLSSMKRVGQAIQLRRIVDGLFATDADALIVVGGDFNAEAEEVPVQAIRGDVENTNNPKLAGQTLVPCEQTIPTSSRYSLFHRGKGEMIDHLLVSRSLLSFYRHTEIHNEILHDESIAFAEDKIYPESDHAPVIAAFEFPS